jgi:hypothetical protein
MDDHMPWSALSLLEKAVVVAVIVIPIVIELVR